MGVNREMSNEIVIFRKADVLPKHERHGQFEYDKYLVLPKAGNQCTAAIMEVPPGKAAFPYHYHVGITEVFYIISGSGVITTPSGDKKVETGDVIVFPPGECGAHKIRNAHETEMLRYLDVDTTNPADVCFYPHSGKVGLILNGRPHSFYCEKDGAGYYDGE